MSHSTFKFQLNLGHPLLILLVVLAGAAASANDNILSMNVGTMDFYEKGISTGPTGSYSFEDYQISTQQIAITYQRRIFDSFYLGATVGNNNLKMLSMGFGW